MSQGGAEKSGDLGEAGAMIGPDDIVDSEA